MTALNITTNDLSDPIGTTRRQVMAYNDNVGETLDRVFNGEMAPVEKVKVTTEEEPANDNEPSQLELPFDLGE